MKKLYPKKITQFMSVFLAGFLCPLFAAAGPDPATTLLENYAGVRDQLTSNQFSRPIVLNSNESKDRLNGDIYSVLDTPIAEVSLSLGKANQWCNILILHINTKYCHATTTASGTRIKINVGKKTPEQLSSTAQINLDFKVNTQTQKFIDITLAAKDGPLGTSGYLIRLEATELPGTKKTFMHLMYSYSANFPARVAMRTYLATIGRNKVGFTIVGKSKNGELEYIGGMRGLMERNTMRYYLAIDSYMGVDNSATAEQQETRMQNWFTAIERYPRQLHEMTRQEYMDMKRAEYSRQNKAQ